jgi:aspartate beta-hydroxylase
MGWQTVRAAICGQWMTVLRASLFSGVVIAKKWLRRIADPSQAQFDRLRPWVLNLINGRARGKPESPWQAGCPELLPGLRASPLWDPASLPWLRAFEEKADEIRGELLALRGQQGFQPLRIPS